MKRFMVLVIGLVFLFTTSAIAAGEPKKKDAAADPAKVEKKAEAAEKKADTKAATAEKKADTKAKVDEKKADAPKK